MCHYYSVFVHSRLQLTDCRPWCCLLIKKLFIQYGANNIKVMGLLSVRRREIRNAERKNELNKNSQSETKKSVNYRAVHMFQMNILKTLQTLRSLWWKCVKCSNCFNITHIQGLQNFNITFMDPAMAHVVYEQHGCSGCWWVHSSWLFFFCFVFFISSQASSLQRFNRHCRTSVSPLWHWEKLHKPCRRACDARNSGKLLVAQFLLPAQWSHNRIQIKETTLCLLPKREICLGFVWTNMAKGLSVTDPSFYTAGLNRPTASD